MKRFKFRLQRVLEYRTVLKKEQERQLAQQHYQLLMAEEGVQQLVEAHDETLLPDQKLMNMAELALAGEYQGALRDLLVQQRLLVLDAVQAVDDAREAYVERAVESEILESLKRRRREEYQEEQRRRERKQLNEIAVQRHRFRKTRAGGDGNE